MHVALMLITRRDAQSDEALTFERYHIAILVVTTAHPSVTVSEFETGNRT